MFCGSAGSLWHTGPVSYTLPAPQLVRKNSKTTWINNTLQLLFNIVKSHLSYNNVA